VLTFILMGSLRPSLADRAIITGSRLRNRNLVTGAFASYWQNPMSRTPFVLRGTAGIALYLAITLAPLALVSVGPRPEPRTFWMELGVALGLVGLSMLGLQFVLTARFRVVSAPYGLDIILQFHRLISFIAVGLVIAHIILVVVAVPENVVLLNPLEAPWRARYAQIATVLLLVILVTSLFRKRLGLAYEQWKLVHGLCAVGVIVFGLMHGLGVGHYLSLAWKQALWALMAVTVLSMFVYVRIVKPILLRSRPYRVREVRPQKGDSWALELEPEGHPGLGHQPGQFAWIKIGDNPFTYREHPFSFSSSSENTETIEFTIKELGDFTSKIGEIAPGTRAYVEGPRGIFTPDRHPSKHYVFVAGGIGISPIIGILRTLADRGDDGEHLLFFANKTEEDITYREEIEGDLSRRLDLSVVHVIEQPSDDWEGERGFLSEKMLNRHLGDDRGDRQYFLCGPEPMLDAVIDALRHAGVPHERIHLEYFQLLD
jgi:predicted ferric reductase